MMNPKSAVKVKHAEQLIEMNTTFAKMIENPMSDEYALLQKLKMENPEFKVSRRKIKSNPNKDSYKGLTYEYMEDYIMTHGSSETVRANLKEFYEKRLIAECHGKAFRYPAIKRWFLEKYPEIVDHGMEKIAQIIEIYDEPKETEPEEQDASA